MNTAILYYSKHHGNTKKLLDAIAASHPVTLIDAANVCQTDLAAYDCIGFASGIYYSKFHKSILHAAQQLPQGKKVFFLYTYGAEKKGYTDAIEKAVSNQGAEILGQYGCFGFNTFGPFKLIGGIAKGHPNQDELDKAVMFYANITK